MTEMSDLELLDALGVEAKTEKKATRTPREERIIAGFEEIQEFVEQHNTEAGRVQEFAARPRPSRPLNRGCCYARTRSR